MSKNWTKKELLKLYYLVKENGNTWTDFSKAFKVSANALYKKYNSTNWDNVLSGEELLSNLINQSPVKTTTLLPTQEDAPQTVEEKITSRKNIIEVKHEVRKQNELLDKIAKEELVVEKITSAIISTPPIKVSEVKYPEKHKFLTRPQEAVLCFSDLHIGLAVRSDEVGGLGNYNVDKFNVRLSNLVKRITAITEHHRVVSRLDTLNIFSLGDIVHGSNDAGQWGFLHTEQNICDQVFIAVREIELALLKLNQVYPRIKFYGVYGNHGRIGQKGQEKKYVNWDYIVYKFLETSLKNQKGITFETPRSPFTVAEVLNNKFFLTHGDQVKGWNGLPYYGMVRAESKYRTILERTKNSLDLWEIAAKRGIDVNDTQKMVEFALNYHKSFDFMVLGHHHSMAEIESSAGGKIILNSSFIGGDDYSINALISANTPCQKFFGVHEEGKSWTYDVRLD